MNERCELLSVNAGPSTHHMFQAYGWCSCAQRSLLHSAVFALPKNIWSKRRQRTHTKIITLTYEYENSKTITQKKNKEPKWRFKWARIHITTPYYLVWEHEHRLYNQSICSHLKLRAKHFYFSSGSSRASPAIELSWCHFIYNIFIEIRLDSVQRL